jgi:hypothetical protein
MLLGKVGSGSTFGVVARFEIFSTSIEQSLRSTPVRNSIEEIWPSPIDRSVRMKRRSPSPRSPWSGCGTIDGLHNAADSIAYSPVKSAPIKSRRLAERERLRGRCDWTSANCCSHDPSRLACRSPNSADRSANFASTSGSVRERTRSIIPLTRPGPPGMKGRIRTRSVLGQKSIPVGLTFNLYPTFVRR